MSAEKAQQLAKVAEEKAVKEAEIRGVLGGIKTRLKHVTRPYLILYNIYSMTHIHIYTIYIYSMTYIYGYMYICI